MRVSIIDLGGTFEATALGFCALGHEVIYFHRGPISDALKSRAQAVIHEPCLDADLVICSASFSDEIWSLETNQNREAPVHPDDPARATINPEQRFFRDRWLSERLATIDQYVMVDMSDMVEPYDPFFFDQGTCHFKREMYPGEGDSGVHHFPFLYNPVLLGVEFLDQFADLLISPVQRAHSPEIVFAGTVGHWRYDGQRIAAVEAFRAQFPDVPLELIEGGMTVGKIWERTQHARGSLYMQGRGRVCFRLHEVAALGISTVACPGAADGLPAAWQHVLPTDVEQMRSPVEMLEFYHQHYHPMRSAQWILDRLDGPSVMAQAVGVSQTLSSVH